MKFYFTPVHPSSDLSDEKEQQSIPFIKIESKKEGISCCDVRRYDQKIYAVGYWDHRTRIFQCKNDKLLTVLRGHTDSITDLRFHPSKNFLVTGGKDKKLNVYQVY
ncbi:G-protein beta WD-40 repeats containing protein [Reticulomyxa filosa]|uniref:G-protein beta WD-40 repeats containing protein n=1 Tax=Reticulomyxa filosa TaxID=46433 RepID=X6PEI3_RETFI|nr:G-protein beta WD-40 repeats containing protein [Reticulomyxa filosa]|eukprot:ETO36636.1 G-protein beta WD-40 repeats containing protein [Reticulomyxa filosa]